MNRYITIYNSQSHGYQTIARKSYNQTFRLYWNSKCIQLAPGILTEKWSFYLSSDLNYQLAVI